MPHCPQCNDAGHLHCADPVRCGNTRPIRKSTRYTVITWTNVGNKIEYDTDALADALEWAKGQRTLHNRTVKIGHGGDSIRHWSRTISAQRNHWATHSTAECSR